MPWVRIDDAYADHPKLAAVGPLGQALWLAGLAYCNRNLTDGFIPWAASQSLLAWQYLEPPKNGLRRRMTIGVGSGLSGEDVTTDYVIELLLDVGLWESMDDGYYVHDYPDYQPSKAEVVEEREKTRDRVRKFRNAPSNATGNAVTNAVETLPPVPVPVPVPTPVTVTSKGSSSTQEQTRARVNGMTHVGAVLPALKEKPTAETTRLTKAQLDAWADFGPEWDAFKRAWFHKGLRFPPQGTPHDDDEDHPSPRAMLYGILDARPTDLPKWITEAPGRTQREVIDYVLDQWHAIRDGAPSQ